MQSDSELDIKYFQDVLNAVSDFKNSEDSEANLKQLNAPSLYRLNDILAYVPLTQMYLGLSHLKQISDGLSNQTKMLCIDSLLASPQIAHLRARTIHYFQSANVLSDSNSAIYYLSKLTGLSKQHERIFDHIFSKLNAFECHSQYWVDGVFAHTTPDKLFLGLEILSKHYSTIKNGFTVMSRYVALLLDEPLSPEILASIIVHLDRPSFLDQDLLKELECLLEHHNQEIQAYQNLWHTQKSEAERAHTLFLNQLTDASLLHLRNQTLQNYMDFRDYLDKIYDLEHLEGDEYQTCFNHLEKIKTQANQECQDHWEKLHSPEYLLNLENTDYQRRMQEIERLEISTGQSLQLHLNNLECLLKNLKLKIATSTLPKEISQISPLIANSRWQPRSIEMEKFSDDTNYFGLKKAHPM